MVMPAQPENPKYTAVQIILLAAEDLTRSGRTEFSEFDLTVAAWKRDKIKFGLRGYSELYPDHKRVMMEIMGQKPNSPVYRRLIEKIRPNTYRLTPQGREAARQLRLGGENPSKSSPASQASGSTVTRPYSPARDLYNTISHYLNRPEFRRWKDDPSHPDDWPTAAAFLGIHKGLDIDPAERLEDIREAIRSAIEWCKQTESDALEIPGPSSPSAPPVPLSELANLDDFLTALAYRFPQHLDRKRHEAGGKQSIRRRFDD